MVQDFELVSRLKTWLPGDILTATALNHEVNPLLFRMLPAPPEGMTVHAGDPTTVTHATGEDDGSNGLMTGIMVGAMLRSVIPSGSGTLCVPEQAADDFEPSGGSFDGGGSSDESPASDPTPS